MWCSTVSTWLCLTFVSLCLRWAESSISTLSSCYSPESAAASDGKTQTDAVEISTLPLVLAARGASKAVKVSLMLRYNTQNSVGAKIHWTSRWTRCFGISDKTSGTIWDEMILISTAVSCTIRIIIIITCVQITSHSFNKILKCVQTVKFCILSKQENSLRERACRSSEHDHFSSEIQT